MKKVVLLGDSIRQIGYGKKVEEILKEQCEVWQPEDNCRFAKYTLRMLFDYKEQIMGADVIHWNNGLWDTSDLFEDGKLFTPLEEYMENMLRIAEILKKWGKKVIFATITPVHPEYEYNNVENIIVYNEAITAELKKYGIKINDLFEKMKDHRLDGICEDKIHLNEKGIELCAGAVVKSIEEAFAEIEEERA